MAYQHTLPLGSAGGLVALFHRQLENLPARVVRAGDGPAEVVSRVRRWVSAYTLDGTSAGWIVEAPRGCLTVQVHAGLESRAPMHCATLSETVASGRMSYADAERLLESAAREVRARSDYAATCDDADRVRRRRRAAA